MADQPSRWNNERYAEQLAKEYDLLRRRYEQSVGTKSKVKRSPLIEQALEADDRAAPVPNSTRMFTR